ncbi:MAG: fasciclin domain-containing protein [Actinobacteria bacterium]|nr:fasciclin domain-containing protein [Actinomycetota bacterium]
MRRATLVGLAGAALLLSASACGSSSSPAATTTTTSAATTTSATTPAMTTTTAMGTAAAKDIVDTAVGAGDFKTLATALTAAGLVDTLKGPGPFTVFAPTDAAFAKLPAGTLDTLLKDPKGDLSAILTYHVVPGKVMAADVVKLNGQTVKTVQGTPLTVHVDGAKVSLKDATGKTVNVVKTDIAASNGVIHVLDGVLLPK